MQSLCIFYVIYADLCCSYATYAKKKLHILRKLCRVYADFMENLCQDYAIYADFLRFLCNLCRFHAVFMQHYAGFTHIVQFYARSMQFVQFLFNFYVVCSDLCIFFYA